MSSLTPEKRPDRNGRIVTRHVRAGGDQSASKRLPAPVLKNSPSASFKPSAARTKHRTWDTDRWSLSRADSALKDACAKYNSSYTYDFTCSDVEAYQVMSVVTPVNAVPVLSTGARTAEEAIAFLKSNGLEHLIVDNSELAREALERNLPAEKLVMGYNKDLPEDAEQSDHFMDALEAATMSSLNNNEGWHSAVIRLTLQGRINIADVKTIGVTRVAALSLGETSQLEAMHKGELGFSVEEYRELVIKTNARNSSDRYTTSAVISLAKKYGAQEILGLNNLSGAVYLANNFRNHHYPEDKVLGALKWADELQVETKFPISTPEIMKLHSAGISVQEAYEGLSADLTAQQIIGIHNGVKSSISEGWL